MTDWPGDNQSAIRKPLDRPRDRSALYGADHQNGHRQQKSKDHESQDEPMETSPLRLLVPHLFLLSVVMPVQRSPEGERSNWSLPVVLQIPIVGIHRHIKVAPHGSG